jgi:HTH-type transcriptional regulator / antitoxin HigA
MPIRPIRNEDDHRAALRELSAFFDIEPDPATPDGERFEILLTPAAAYEAMHFPADLSDPVDAIKSAWNRAASRRRTWSP